MSMRWQLIVAFGLIILVALGSVAVISQITAEREVISFLRYGGQINLENLADSLITYYARNNSWSGVESVFSMVAQRGRGQRSGGNAALGQSTLANANGLIIYSENQAHTGNKLSDTEINNAIALRISNEIVGYLLPEGGVLQYPHNFDTLLVERINRATLISALISGVVAVILAAIFAGIIQQPVRGLTTAVKKMSEGDLAQRVEVRGGGEIAVLGETFNEMAQSLQIAASRRKALTADIAHELRNPLAVQRAQLEALQDGLYPLNLEQLNRLYAQNAALSCLVEDLRLLAIADAGELSLDRIAFDLAPLCLDVVANFNPQTMVKKILLQTDLQPGVFFVSADKQRIQQIINNLMQNALRYTPEKGLIKLRLSEVNGDVHLALYNSGPQMSEQTLTHLFERFYRGDQGRDRAGGGTGLGLSIARKLAEAHHGSLTGKNHPKGGVVFTLSLPLVKSK
jgi:two-component system, OmpR family, sensor histidine kinase BaeS